MLALPSSTPQCLPEVPGFWLPAHFPHTGCVLLEFRHTLPDRSRFPASDAAFGDNLLQGLSEHPCFHSVQHLEQTPWKCDCWVQAGMPFCYDCLLISDPHARNTQAGGTAILTSF